MAIERRTLLRGLGAALLLPFPIRESWGASREPLYAAARRHGDGRFSAAVFDRTGRDRAHVALPARGHDVAVRPGTGEVVAFARRPGDFAVAFGARNRRPPLWFAPPEGRHFYGHGVFSADGRLLYASENGIETGQGLIGVYDATDGFAPLGAWSSGGIGPHDLALMPDGRTLVVANGGVRTHPDHGRGPLNLDAMAPSLVYLDTATWNRVASVRLPPVLHQLSLRHLAVGPSGEVVIGCQYKGPRGDRPDLLVTHRPGEEPRPLALPAEAGRRLRNYVSSVAIDASGAFAAVTSSKGSVALIVDIAARRLVATHALADVSGVAGTRGARGGFLLTAGSGAVQRARLGERQAMATRADLAWDNHVVRVS